MNVFAFFDPDEPHPLTRLWVKSWAARGWTPRLILPSERSPDLSDRQIANRRGGGKLSQLNAINFGYRHLDKRCKLSEWPETDGDVVFFPKGATEETVLHCGRELNAD